MTETREIAESYINGNRTWVKAEIIKAENPKIIAGVYNELKEMTTEEDSTNFMLWISRW